MKGLVPATLLLATALATAADKGAVSLLYADESPQDAAAALLAKAEEQAGGRKNARPHRDAPDPVGVQGVPVLLVTPDAAAYAYNVTRKLSELYVVEGLR